MSRTDSPDQHRILILDFGSQYTQLIARRIRELGVYCEIVGPAPSDEALTEFEPSGIVLSGGPASVNDDDMPPIPDAVLNGHWPVLGICYGMQAFAAQLGGEVETASHQEYGRGQIKLSLIHI